MNINQLSGLSLEKKDLKMNVRSNVVVFEPDLLFSSRIEGQAAKTAVDVKVVTDYDELLRELTESVPRFLAIDLDALEGKLASLGDAIRGKSCVSVGYYSHVNTRLAEDAKRFGIDMIMTRSAFVNRIGEILVRVSRG